MVFKVVQSMRFSCSSLRLCFFLLSFISALPTIAQQSKAKDKSTQTAVRVTLMVEAFDENAPDAEVKKESLHLTEDSVSQSLDLLETGNQSVSYGLVLDTSGSMREYFSGVVLLGISLIDQLGKNDEMFVVQAKAEAELTQDLTSDKDALYKSIKALYTGGGTALYSAIVAAADHLKQKAKHSRRVLIVVTDVVDQRNDWNLVDALSATSENDVQVSVIRLFNQQILKKDDIVLYGKGPMESQIQKGTTKFEGLTSVTGGVFIKYSVPLKITKEEAPALLQAAQDYTRPIFQKSKARSRISYFTTNSKFDGRPRNVQVFWQTSEGKTSTKEFGFVLPKK
jgi:VWFA-related protein